MTRYKVGVEMGFEDVFDAGLVLLSLVDIGLHFRGGSMIAASPSLSM